MTEEQKHLLRQVMQHRAPVGCPSDEALKDFQSGGSTDGQRAALEAHLRMCGVCLDRLIDLEVIASVAEDESDETASLDFTNTLKQRLVEAGAIKPEPNPIQLPSRLLTLWEYVRDKWMMISAPRVATAAVVTMILLIVLFRPHKNEQPDLVISPAVWAGGSGQALPRFGSIYEQMTTKGFSSVASIARHCALVIGNGAYADAPLDNSVHDATDLARVLQQLHFSVTSLTDATREEMEKKLQEFALQLPECDVGLFYFSGHGVQVDGQNFLVPVDGIVAPVSNADVLRKSVSVSRVVDTMEGAGKVEGSRRANHILILDTGWRFTRQASGLIDPEPPHKGILIALATDPSAVAEDRGRSDSPFTKNLIQQLQRPGLSVEDVFREVGRRVVAETNGVQRPFVQTNLTKRLVFIPDPGTKTTNKGDRITVRIHTDTGSGGFGIVVGKNLLLTNAQVVNNSTVVLVSSEANPSLASPIIPAQVVRIEETVNLALLRTAEDLDIKGGDSFDPLCRSSVGIGQKVSIWGYRFYKGTGDNAGEWIRLPELISGWEVKSMLSDPVSPSSLPQLMHIAPDRDESVRGPDWGIVFTEEGNCAGLITSWDADGWQNIAVTSTTIDTFLSSSSVSTLPHVPVYETKARGPRIRAVFHDGGTLPVGWVVYSEPQEQKVRYTASVGGKNQKINSVTVQEPDKISVYLDEDCNGMVDWVGYGREIGGPIDGFHKALSEEFRRLSDLTPELVQALSDRTIAPQELTFCGVDVR